MALLLHKQQWIQVRAKSTIKSNNTMHNKGTTNLNISFRLRLRNLNRILLTIQKKILYVHKVLPIKRRSNYKNQIKSKKRNKK